MGKNPNIVLQPFLILFFVSTFMTMVSLINSDSEFLPDFISDIKKPSSVLEIQKILVVDSVTKDTIIKEIQRVSVVSAKDTIYEKNISSFNNFFKALDSLQSGKKKKIRIAYFGDSMIEGDFITDDLRRLFQKKYGGSGVGYVPITSVVSNFRRTIGHTYSDNWKDYHFSNRYKKELFLSGHIFYGSEGSSIQYKSEKKYGTFKKIYLLHGMGKCTIKYKGDSSVKEIVLESDKVFNKIPLVLNSGTKHIELNTIACDSTGLFGLSFESEAGVILDNYSFRGISGIEYNTISSEMYEAVSSEMPYDLIILHYGLNVENDSTLSYHWYETKFANVVKKFKIYFPDATILIAGVSDRAYKKEGIFTTSPGVPALTKIQRRIAAKEGVSFWNLYSAMGGYNAMVKWVTETPVLAHTDYTHVNNAGARKIATALFNYLEAEYLNYKKINSTEITKTIIK